MAKEKAVKDKSDLLKIITKELLPSRGRDDDYMYGIKSSLMSLPEDEKRIMLLYIEYGSFREVGKILGCSQTAVWQVVKTLRKKIIDNI